MDKVKKFLGYDGRISIICADTKELVEEIKNINDLTPTTTATMGRLATIAGIMGLTEIKEANDSITIQVKGEGPVGLLVCVIKNIDNISKIKTYIQNPLVEMPLKENGKIDVGSAVGKYGFLNVIKENKMTDSEYNGLVPLVSGEIAEDFTEYFAKSMQKPTVIALGVLVNKDGVKASGGYMINLMPDATEEDIKNIEEAVKNSPSISQMLDEEYSLEKIAKTVTGDENIRVIDEEVKIVYECDCSKEKFEKGLISLGKTEIEKIIVEDGKADIKCQFCNKEYYFSKEELENLIKEI
jgi:molecular chaperone Hsp33